MSIGKKIGLGALALFAVSGISSFVGAASLSPSPSSPSAVQGIQATARPTIQVTVAPTSTPAPTDTPTPFPTKTPPPVAPRQDVCAGATAICGDGSCSYSQNHRGTCSHHGGVSEWLD